jgi:replicative superfamily II helicase
MQTHVSKLEELYIHFTKTEKEDIASLLQCRVYNQSEHLVKLHHYLSLLTAQMPIESQFIQSLADHLNAEIILGTVTNVQEAITWITYTYLYNWVSRFR